MPSFAVPGRICGSCMMCCKLPVVSSLNKEAGILCSFARAGHGCINYDKRPDECRTFYCDWMLNANLGPEWKPSVAKFLTYTNVITGNFIILTDDLGGDSWKNELYYSLLKYNASKLIEEGKLTMVFNENKLTIVLPDRDETVNLNDIKNFSVSKVNFGRVFRYSVSVE